MADEDTRPAPAVQPDSTPPAPPTLRNITSKAIFGLIVAILVNIATSRLPENWQSYTWLALPLVVLVTVWTIFDDYHESRSASRLGGGEAPSADNRAKMLAKVEDFWIEGVLNQSLYRIARVELGLEHDPEKVSHPWETVVQRGAITRTVPAGTPMIDLFDELEGTMLILGAPGAGKTTMLLELARDLVARARKNKNYPIPLVFNLSTWANKHPPLKEWIAEELNLRYNVPSKLAQAWVEADAILPLLDGFDEVAGDHREDCLEAINTYRQGHGLTPLVVCSRIGEYQALTEKLHLKGAVVIQLLTRPAIEAYLRQVGAPLAAVLAVLQNDPALWELLDSPLMLSIVALAYNDKSPTQLHTAGTLDEHRRRLFNDYITAMFERVGRSDNPPTPAQAQAKRRLSWLAGQMVRHKLTVYYIEQMQPDWLPRNQQWIPIFGLALVGWLIGMTIGGVFGGLAGGLGGDLVDWPFSWPFRGVDGVLFGGLFGGMFGGGLAYNSRIESMETVRWRWSSDILASILVFAVSGVLGSGLVGVRLGGLHGGLIFGLLGLLLGMVLGVLGGGLAGVELEDKTVPNQGIRRSVRNGLIFGLGGGLGGVLVGVLVFGQVGGLMFRSGGGLVFGRNSVQSGILGGVLGVLGGSLGYGGRTVLQHYILRWLLFRNGSLPFSDGDLIRFLDDAAERILLRRVGGGYIFVHRLLMEHFASLNTAETAGSQGKHNQRLLDSATSS